jgi:hypothetical protein
MAFSLISSVCRWASRFVAGRNDLLLQPAYLDVIGEDLGREAHPQAPTVIDRRLKLRVGGFDLSPHATKDVQFPGSTVPTTEP